MIVGKKWVFGTVVTEFYILNLLELFVSAMMPPITSICEAFTGHQDAQAA